MQNPIKALFPKTIATYHSDFNGEITITKLLGRLSLNVGNLAQSSKLVEDIWKKVFENISKKHNPKNILILGLAGGSMLPHIEEYWPSAKITAIEIDPVMIKICKKHFNLNNYKNLTIINKDAQDYVKTTTEKFDLILVDMYCGRDLPSFVSSDTFITHIKDITSKNGVAVFNRVSLKGQDDEVRSFQNTLEEHYTKVTQIKTPANKLFACKHE